MSELNIYHHELRRNEYAEFYLKFQADKVIAELEDKCQMHDFFWEGCGFAKRGFKNAIAVSEAYDFLEKENKELKETQRWRKFSEERPEEKQWILVFVENPSKYGTYIELRRWDNGCKYDVDDQELYTKWMPLPEPPEVSK